MLVSIVTQNGNHLQSAIWIGAPAICVCLVQSLRQRLNIKAWMASTGCYQRNPELNTEHFAFLLFVCVCAVCAICMFVFEMDRCHRRTMKLWTRCQSFQMSQMSPPAVKTRILDALDSLSPESEVMF